MLHLFNKVYIEHEDCISPDYDRVVISATNGVELYKSLEEISSGELIAHATSLDELVGAGKTYASYVAMFTALANKVKESGKVVYIYVDPTTYYKLSALWLKIVLPNVTSADATRYMRTNHLHQKLWHYSRKTATVAIDALANGTFNEGQFQFDFNNTLVNRSDYESFINDNVAGFSVELLLASYVYNGSRKTELKNSIKPLLKKEIEKLLYEFKEVVVYHMSNASVMTALGSSTTYTIDNLQDAVNDSASKIAVFFKNSIWNTEGIGVNSTNNSININNITADDIANIKAMVSVAQGDWNYSEVNKLDFIPYVQKATFDDADLTAILDYDQSNTDILHTSGAFYSTEHTTVNNYFVKYVMGLRGGNVSALNAYVV
jgi:hypothetical protein